MLKNIFGQFDRPAKIIKCGETGDFYVEEKSRKVGKTERPEVDSMEYKVLSI